MWVRKTDEGGRGSDCSHDFHTHIFILTRAAGLTLSLRLSWSTTQRYLQQLYIWSDARWQRQGRPEIQHTMHGIQ